ncbi:hypothetical protein GUITHDRAFT_114798 [Guillardia theta CCMP2712]|uniref:Uncharacterized protein n=1 Tax=Guillardia theta (strain CCMP2712) TaxID=905079 RepID=L1ITH9_GUITC|nr:hypothetical protein GUITHDRAFT_114798 [Guillardia theta CCMP2712]EKX39140.1 hypothetical protein GUITHDRAFT_114798 [Guillardia theta CCMP2712]|eukprot:XP_005826120.1 hypothetical protein GUITHDRAFT_114798 [Guillardia theta CCMP2712]
MESIMKERFVVNLCLMEVYQVFNIPLDMLRPLIVETKPFKTGQQAPESIQGQPMATWLPKHRVSFLIYVDRDGNTLIFLDDKLYLAHPDLMLCKAVPANSCFLAHYTEDQVTLEASVPKILVFDCPLLDSKSLMQTSPYDRYKLLLANCNMKHCNPIYSLQWVGFESSVVEKYEELKISLPHEVDHIIRINQDPFTPSKLLKISVPQWKPQPKTCP